MIKVKLRYILLNGKTVEKVREFNFEKFPGYYDLDHCVSHASEEPRGMFFISDLDYDRKRFTLRQLDCNEIHWNSKDGIVRGPDEECEIKKCRFLHNCPISTLIMIMADND